MKSNLFSQLLTIIIIVGIITVLFSDKLSRHAINCTVICYILVMIMNFFMNIELSFDLSDIKVDYENLKIHSENYKKQYNIFFDDIKAKRYSDEKEQ